MARKSKKDQGNFEKLKREMTVKKNKASKQPELKNKTNEIINNIDEKSIDTKTAWKKPIVTGLEDNNNINTYEPDSKEASILDNRQQEKQEPAYEKIELVVFNINEIEYAIHISKVKEIIRIPYLIKMPNVQEAIKGLCNLRGELLPVIEAGKLFNVHSKEFSELSRIIVLENNGQKAGMITDKVAEVISISREYVKEAPTNIKGMDNGYVDGIVILDNGKRVIILLNTEAIISLGNLSYHDEKEIVDIKEEIFETQENDEEQILLFYIAGGEYGINVNYVKEIIRLPKLSKSPYAPIYIEGLFSIRKELIPLINLGKLLDISSAEPNDAMRVVVINYENSYFGILVDKVSQIARINRKLLIDKSKIEYGYRIDFISGMISLDNGNRLVMILEPYSLIKLSATDDKVSTARVINTPDKSDESDNIYEHLLIFKLNNEEYAINIGYVHEISRINEITRLPGAPYYIDGMVDLRGELLPVLNLRKAFNMQSFYTYTDDKIIVAEYENKRLGILIDSTSEIIKLHDSNIEDAPKLFNESSGSNYIHKVAKLSNNTRNVMILNLPVLFAFCIF